VFSFNRAGNKWTLIVPGDGIWEVMENEVSEIPTTFEDLGARANSPQDISRRMPPVLSEQSIRAFRDGWEALAAGHYEVEVTIGPAGEVLGVLVPSQTQRSDSNSAEGSVRLLIEGIRSWKFSMGPEMANFGEFRFRLQLWKDPLVSALLKKAH
jgi:hypothetical protein